MPSRVNSVENFVRANEEADTVSVIEAISVRYAPSIRESVSTPSASTASHLPPPPSLPYAAAAGSGGRWARIAALRAGCRRVHASRWFERGIVGAICANTLVLMLWSFPAAPDATLQRYDYASPTRFCLLWSANALLTGLFTLELSIKLLALGPAAYVRDRVGLFDTFVVFVSLLEMMLDLVNLTVEGTEVGVGPWLSVLRTLRILRIFRLLQFYSAMRETVSTLVASVYSLAYLSLLLALLVFVYALLGMEFFGGAYPRPERNYTRASYPDVFDAYGLTWPDDTPAPRENFDTLGSALVMVFIALSGENWNDIYFVLHEARAACHTHTARERAYARARTEHPTTVCRARWLPTPGNVHGLVHYGHRFLSEPVHYWDSHTAQPLSRNPSVAIPDGGRARGAAYGGRATDGSLFSCRRRGNRQRRACPQR